MYKMSDYIKRGVKMVNNNLMPSKKKLSTIMLYATDRCDSKCKHCFIWEKSPKQHLSFTKIKEILNSKVVDKDTVIGLEGGEFLLHPEATEILTYLSANHPKYDLLSNALKPDKLIDAVKKYKPMRLFLSLDGDQGTYKYMRGVDGYDKVLKVMKALQGVVPVSIMFTLTPFNTFEDLKHVAAMCKKYDADMRIGIYNTMEFFDTKTNQEQNNSLNYSINEIPDVVKDFEENYDFMALYTHYREGNLKLSCNSIKDSIVIYPNGDIPICQNKQLVLGNLNKEPLEEIINKPATIKIHQEHKNGCNGCWINFHRKYDIILYRNLEKVMPKKMINSILGEYYWSADKTKKYKDIVN
jgi:MoaA/NifB/PqqE/SkfB family radical SAM enzyme